MTPTLPKRGRQHLGTSLPYPHPDRIFPRFSDAVKLHRTNPGKAVNARGPIVILVANCYNGFSPEQIFLIQIVRHNPGHSVSLQRSAEPQKALGVLNVLSRAEKSGTLKKNVHPLCGIPTSDRIIFWVSSGVPVVLTWYTVVRLRRSETYRFRIRALNGFFTSRCGLK